MQICMFLPTSKDSPTHMCHLLLNNMQTVDTVIFCVCMIKAKHCNLYKNPFIYPSLHCVCLDKLHDPDGWCHHIKVRHHKLFVSIAWTFTDFAPKRLINWLPGEPACINKASFTAVWRQRLNKLTICLDLRKTWKMFLTSTELFLKMLIHLNLDRSQLIGTTISEDRKNKLKDTTGGGSKFC